MTRARARVRHGVSTCQKDSFRKLLKNLALANKCADKRPMRGSCSELKQSARRRSAPRRARARLRRGRHGERARQAHAQPGVLRRGLAAQRLLEDLAEALPARGRRRMSARNPEARVVAQGVPSAATPRLLPAPVSCATAWRAGFGGAAHVPSAPLSTGFPEKQHSRRMLSSAAQMVSPER